MSQIMQTSAMGACALRVCYGWHREGATRSMRRHEAWAHVHGCGHRHNFQAGPVRRALLYNRHCMGMQGYCRDGLLYCRFCTLHRYACTCGPQFAGLPTHRRQHLS